MVEKGHGQIRDGGWGPAVEVGVVGMTVGYRGAGMGCVALVEMAADAWPLPDSCEGKVSRSDLSFFN